MLPLILAGGMIAKNQLIDKPKEERERKLQAITAQYSPWTGMTPQAVKETSAMEAGLQGAGAGIGMQQSMDMQDAQLGALKSQSDYFNRSGASAPGDMSMPQASSLQAPQIMSYGPAKKKGSWDGQSLSFGQPKNFG